MDYELQVHALSPLSPTLRELVAKAGESGLVLEVVESGGSTVELDSSEWSRVALRLHGDEGSFLIEVSGSHESVLAALRAERESGEDVPDRALEARRLYVLRLATKDDGEDPLAAFVVGAWGLASLTEGLVHDPQEEFYADADSFWALITHDEPS